MNRASDSGIGAIIAEYRQRRSLTRAELAALVRQAAARDGERDCRVDGKTVLRWENGQPPRPAYLRWLAAALDLPVEQLSRAGKIDVQEDETETQRREFARLTAWGVIGAMMPVGVDWDRIAALGGKRPVDDRGLDDLEAISAAYGRLWRTAPPGTLLSAVHAHLGTLGRLAPVGGRAVGMAADVATLAGYMAEQTEDRGRAIGYWTLARQLASDVGGETEARVLIATSGLQSVTRVSGAQTPSRASLALLDAAHASIGPDGSRLLLAWLTARRAEEHAALGDERLADADLSAAEGYLHEPGPQQWSTFGPGSVPELDNFRGNCTALLGRYEDAARVLRASLDTMPADLVAWRAVVSADLGAALAGMGEVEEAVRLLLAALDLTIEAGTPVHVRRIRGVRQRHLSRFADVTAVRHLDERLATIL
jgi:transcriptional regulator with XRE-family HTH domain